MKRLLLILLALLLLAGCAVEEAPETSEPSTEPTTTEAPDPGLYVPDSAIEQQTGGAVRLYGLEESKYTWITAMGSKLLLASGEKTTDLTVLMGDKCQTAATASVDTDLAAASLQITTMGLAYYSETKNSVIYLDGDLRQLDSVPLPEDAAGKVLIDPKNDNIYYCTADQIRALDPDTGISRLIRKQSCQSQDLLGIHFDGTVLSCRVTDLSGEEGIVYFSGQTGEALSNDQKIIALSTYEKKYFALRQDGAVRQQIFGSVSDTVTARSLNLTGDLKAVLSLGGVVKCAVTENGLVLDLYDLESGRRSASVTLPGVTEVTSITADKNSLWMLAFEGAVQRLYRWDVQESLVDDETVFAGPVYTAAAPDESGLQACQERVDALNKAHGLAIRIWQDAVKEPGRYVLQPEHQTEAINKCLDELEPVLALFPENFLYKSVNTRVRICIVRSVSEETVGLHYWLNDDSFIILSAGVNVREEFLKAVGYVISTNVMGNSPILDSWSSLNPQGFTYGAAEGFEQYLTGDAMAFADVESMQSVTEDRSRLFRYAMKADNAQMFQSPAMQAKLLLLCRGIRDAWRLERKTDVYPWEQYLTESIAYVKK